MSTLARSDDYPQATTDGGDSVCKFELKLKFQLKLTFYRNRNPAVLHGLKLADGHRRGELKARHFRLQIHIRIGGSGGGGSGRCFCLSQAGR